MSKRSWGPKKHRSRPPRAPWHEEHEFPQWMHARHRRDRLFVGFAGLFGCMALLVLGGMAALVFLFVRLLTGDGQTAVLIWVGGCGLSLALPLSAVALATLGLRNVAAPLANVMAAADAVAEGDLGVRVPEDSPGDFAKLARSFNRMTEELQRADQQRRNLTADVAHELRTPLQIIQGNLEGILDDVYQPTAEHIGATLDETRLLARLVDDLRTLSLAEAGQLPLTWEPVDVAELLADVRTSFSGQAEAAGVDLRLDVTGGPAALILTADVGRLGQVLGNLVANALRHTPSGGRITLGAAPHDDDLRTIHAAAGTFPIQVRAGREQRDVGERIAAMSQADD